MSGGDFSQALAPNIGEMVNEIQANPPGGSGVDQPDPKKRAKAKAKAKARAGEGGADGADPQPETPTTPLQQAKALAKSVLLISNWNKSQKGVSRDMICKDLYTYT